MVHRFLSWSRRPPASLVVRLDKVIRQADSAPLNPNPGSDLSLVALGDSFGSWAHLAPSRE